MYRIVSLSVVAACMFLGSSALAESRPIENNHHNAPEPLTVLGLALGAGSLAAVRWASKRKG